MILVKMLQKCGRNVFLQDKYLMNLMRKDINHSLLNSTISCLKPLNRYNFAVPKHKNTIDGVAYNSKIQNEKQSPNQNNYYLINEVSWKLSTFINIAAVPFLFFYNTQTITVVLIANSILQMMAQSDRFQSMVKNLQQTSNFNQYSKYTSKMQQMSQSSKYSTSSKSKQQALQTANEGYINQNKTTGQNIQIAKNTYLKFFKNLVILCGITGLTMYAPYFESGFEVSLIAVNFWTFYNIKFNKFSHGFYYTLLSSLIILALYFSITNRSKLKQNSLDKDQPQNAVKKSQNSQK